MFLPIRRKPVRLLFSNSLISILIHGALSLVEDVEPSIFLIPDVKGGAPTKMDQTFYYVCPYFDNSTRCLHADFLHEVRKRSCLAEIIFPHSDREWLDLLIETELINSDGFDKHPIKIVTSDSQCRGPGQYIKDHYEITSSRAHELLDVADELYNLPADKWNNFAISYVENAVSRPPGVGYCKLVSDSLVRTQDLQYFLSTPINFDRHITTREDGKQSKIVSHSENHPKIIRSNGIADLESARTALFEINRSSPGSCIIITTVKSLMVYTPRKDDLDSLVSICNTPEVYYDSEGPGIIAPIALLNIFETLLTNKRIKL